MIKTSKMSTTSKTGKTRDISMTTLTSEMSKAQAR